MQSGSFAHATRSQDIGKITKAQINKTWAATQRLELSPKRFVYRKEKVELDDFQLLGRHPADIAVTEFDLRPTGEFLTDLDFQTLVNDE